ncbi:MAG: methyltransferase domain-containing protein [Archangiaceae bacterium]|nr:methyltransferase domain-containing protein [Archangiaceae bacterium]
MSAALEPALPELGLAQYLDLSAHAGLDPVTRARRDAQLGLKAGSAVLDVGCGTGEDVRALAQWVGPTGRAVGVDVNEGLLEEAARRGGGPNVEWHLGDATALPFADATFDAVRAERVFQHLDAPQRAAAELYRVLKPGGVVRLLDQDWESLSIAGADPALTRRICRAFVDGTANGRAGPRHLELLRRAGFVEREVMVRAPWVSYAVALPGVLQPAVFFAHFAQAASEAETAQWLAALRAADAQGDFACSFVFYEVTARKCAAGHS